MKKFVNFIIATIFLSISANAQSINADDLRDALVSAINLRNRTEEKPLRFIIFYDLCEYENDSIIKELNKNDEGFIFYKGETRAEKRRFAYKIKKIKFTSWRILFFDIECNRISLVINKLHYNLFKKYSLLGHGVLFVCRKSDYSGKWYAADERFIVDRFRNAGKTDYSVITKQIFEKLQNGILETDTDYKLLFNYLTKQDDSEYYPKIKELLKCLIGKNPEINERVQTYFYLYEKMGTEYSASTIVNNYYRILDRPNCPPAETMPHKAQ